MSVVGTPPAPPPVTPDSGFSAGQIGADFSQALYNQINTNPQDGGVSKQEFQSYLQNQGVTYDSAAFDKAFDQADTSNDDFLSYQEMEAAWDDFSQLGSASETDQSQNDANNSSEKKEPTESKSKPSESKGDDKTEGTEGTQGSNGSNGGFSLASLWEYLLGKYDKDGDGKIDAEELAAMKEENPEMAEKIDGLLEKAGINPAEGITQEKLQGAVDSGKITEAELKTLSEGLGMA